MPKIQLFFSLSKATSRASLGKIAYIREQEVNLKLSSSTYRGSEGGGVQEALRKERRGLDQSA